MRFPIAIFASLVATTLSQAAEPELEGHEGLSAKCRSNPGNSAAFCSCLAARAVAELPRATRQLLYATWGHPTIFNFRAPMEANDLAQYDEEQWGPWQRKSVPACNSNPN
jgi:hypothetical protein